MSIIRQEHPMPKHDAIERRAYELCEQRGREDGHDCAGRRVECAQVEIGPGVMWTQKLA